MHFKRKRAEPIFGSQLRFAEKPAGIYVTRKSTGRNSSKIIDTSRIRTVIKIWRPGPAREWKAARRRRAITRSLIFLNDCTGQGAGGRACGCAN
jgi:hypothetical protein